MDEGIREGLLMSNFAEDFKQAILSQDVNTYKRFNFKYHKREGFDIPTDEEIELRLKWGLLYYGTTEQKQQVIEWLYENDVIEVLRWI